MKRTLAVLLPMLAVVVLLLAGGAWADAAGPGSCFGGSPHEYKEDAGSDGNTVFGRGPSRSSTRRTGVGLMSAAFVTSGWLFLRRQDRRR